LEFWQFFTSTTAPWWSALFGIALGSVGSWAISWHGDIRKATQRQAEIAEERKAELLVETRNTVTEFEAACENWFMEFSTTKAIRMSLPETRKLPAGSAREDALKYSMNELGQSTALMTDAIKDIINLNAKIMILADSDITSKVQDIWLKTIELHGKSDEAEPMREEFMALRKERLELTFLARKKFASN
jgi:hypothetical protein